MADLPRVVCAITVLGELYELLLLLVVSEVELPPDKAAFACVLSSTLSSVLDDSEADELEEAAVCGFTGCALWT